MGGVSVGVGEDGACVGVGEEDVSVGVGEDGACVGVGEEGVSVGVGEEDGVDAGCTVACAASLADLPGSV
jgi:hypothetical protein